MLLILLKLSYSNDGHSYFVAFQNLYYTVS